MTNEFDIDWNDGLHGEIHQSKRSGFIEFSGWLFGETNRGDTIKLSSFYGGKVNISVRISTPSVRYTILEGMNVMWRESLMENWIVTKKEFKVEQQSNLTHKVVEELFLSGRCNLTEYSVSMNLHLPFLRTLLNRYNIIQSSKTNLCPIT